MKGRTPQQRIEDFILTNNTYGLPYVNETLWPEYQELSQTLHAYLNEVTERVIREEIHGDSSEAEDD